MQNMKLLIGVIGGTLILVLGVAFLFSGQSASTTETTSLDQLVVMGDSRHLHLASAEGESEASDSGTTDNSVITIVEFSDFQCPACRAAAPIAKDVVESNPGRVALVYRHFPLETIHRNARAAALVAEAASMQGKFWEYHDILFTRQEDWAGESNPEAKFLKYAEELELDMGAFEEAMKSDEVKNLVDSDITDGLTFNVNSTPTFFVDGQKVGTGDLAQVVAAKL